MSDARHGEFWTEERLERLKDGFERGWSFQKIADHVGGCTRNACVGKAARLGWFRDGNGTRKRPAATKVPARPKPPPVAAVVDPGEARDVARIPRLELLGRTHCKWPIGDPQDAGFGWCGATKDEEARYCPVHQARAFKPLPEKTAGGLRLARSLRRFAW